MAWILLLLAAACFIFTFFTTSIGLGVCCVLLSLVMVVAATMMLLSARMGDASRSAMPLTADELRAMREQAEARRVAKADAAPGTGNPDVALPAPEHAPQPPSST